MGQPQPVRKRARVAKLYENLIENHTIQWCFLLFSNSAVDKLCFSMCPKYMKQASKLAFVATVSSECYQFDFRLFGLIGIFHVACFQTGYHCRRPILLLQCWVVENAHKKYIFPRNSKQIKLPVLDAHEAQITRLYLKYNALYYIATI